MNPVKLTVEDILPAVERVLRDAAKGKGSVPRALTDYNILHRLPERDVLLQQYGEVGKGGGNNFSAATMVGKAANMLVAQDKAKKDYIDCKEHRYLVGTEWVEPSYEVCATFAWIG